MNRSLIILTLAATLMNGLLHARPLEVIDGTKLERARLEAEQLGELGAAGLRTRLMLAYLLRLHVEKSIYTQQLAGVSDGSLSGKSVLVVSGSLLAEGLVAGVGLGSAKTALSYLQRPEVRAFNEEFERVTQLISDAKNVLKRQGRTSATEMDMAAVELELEVANENLKTNRAALWEVLNRKTGLKGAAYNGGLRFAKVNLVALGLLIVVDELSYSLEVTLVKDSTLKEFKNSLDRYIEWSEETLSAYSHLK